MKWLTVLLLTAATLGAQSIQLSDAQALEIGRRIWKNECAGTVSGLTSWNSNEAFASLGIGHFIWYPTAQKGIYEESFPKLVAYYQKRGIKIPAWLTPETLCPWPNKAAFQAGFSSEKMKTLRELLASTVPIQAQFAALRLEAALPKMLESAPVAEREKIRKNFYRVAAEPLGLYALMDYVNFKGEGTSSSERYQGKGWGLLQVLEGMGNGPALPEFAASANRALTRRVENAPPGKKEAQWLPGWRNRLATYTN